MTFLLLEEGLSRATDYPNLILGPLLLLVAIYVTAASTVSCGGRAVADALLAIDGLTKRFGGVVASDGISLALARGEMHAIIGPNGAGKTTLIGQLTGEIAPDAAVSVSTAATSRHCRFLQERARAGALVPDHVAVSRFHRARQCRARGTGA